MARNATEGEPGELTYALGAISKLTGLSPDVLRAWERRYAVVTPLRTAGGTRRYRASDLERLRLVKAAVDAGHRIGDVARLDAAALAELGRAPEEAPSEALSATLDAVARLDVVEAERQIALQLSALGPARFATRFAVPLLEAIGEGWQAQRLCVASEHMASALLRSLLGSSLRPTAQALRSPRIVFATPAGERHELGLLIAALTAIGAGGHVVYLGPDLPAQELIAAAAATGAAALALGVVAIPAERARAELATIRSGLAPETALWVGGALATRLELPPRCLLIDSLARLEQRVGLLVLGAGEPGV